MSQNLIRANESNPTTTSDIVTASNKTVENSAKKFPMDVNMIDGVERAHYMVHASKFWSASKIFSNIADNGTAIIICQVGANEMHLGCGFGSGGNFTYELIEGVTATSNGTTLTAYNNNRARDTATSAQWFHTPTGLSTTGTTIFSGFVGGGEKNAAIGGADGSPVRGGSEWLLAPSQKYAFRITNLAGSTQTCWLGFGYYERE